MNIVLKNKKRTLSTWAISLLSILVATTAARAGDTGKSFIWEVAGKAGKSYILGSVHVLKKEMHPLPGVIEDAFANTDTLVVEANLAQDKVVEVMQLTMDKGMYKGEETLKDNISTEVYEMAQKRLADLGMKIEQFQKHKPWMVAMTITGMELMKMGYNPEFGVDKYFLEKASGKKEIRELEGAIFQINLLNSFSPRESEKFLFSSLQETANFKEEIDQLVDAWLRGDVILMEKLVTHNVRRYPELKNIFKKLTDDRNVTMAQKIAAMLREEHTFLVVVGAAHMVGEKGVIRLLRQKGFALKQL